MEQPPMAIGAGHRDQHGDIGRKYGNTLLRTLRQFYGAHFADGCWDSDEKLSDALHKIDDWSLSKLVHDHGRGKLADICRQAA